MPEENLAPRVSVVIPCRNEARNIENCLRSVLAFEAPPGGFEVLVVDGMSNDGTRDILQRIVAQEPRVRVIDNPEKITPTAMNHGIRAARGEIVIRMDARCRYAPNYVSESVRVREEKQAATVGGPCEAQGDTYIQKAIAIAYNAPLAVGGGKAHSLDYEGPADTVHFGCWSKALFEKIGYFDEELVRNQDDEFNLRIHRSGGLIWQSPHIRSSYAPRRTVGELWRQYFQYGYWKVRVIQKHKIPASIRHLVPGTFVVVMLLLALLSLFLPLARIAFVGLGSLYLLFLLLSSAVAAARSGWNYLPILPVVIAAYQLSYGTGFLCGIWDFMILKRRGRFVNLTRK